MFGDTNIERDQINKFLRLAIRSLAVASRARKF